MAMTQTDRKYGRMVELDLPFAAGHAPGPVLEQLAHALTNRLLHAPTAALREAAADGDEGLARAAERLFLQPDDPRRGGE